MLGKISTLLCALILAGCAGLSEFSGFDNSAARITPAQECAVGYDLSKQIFKHINIKDTVLKSPNSKTSHCEFYMTKYLRAAGYRIDDTQDSKPMKVVIARDGPSITAFVNITTGLRITRSYSLTPAGVRPLGPPTIAALPTPQGDLQ